MVLGSDIEWIESTVDRFVMGNGYLRSGIAWECFILFQTIGWGKQEENREVA